MNIEVKKSNVLKEKPKDETKLGFGSIFTDHMFIMEHNAEKGWVNAKVEELHNISISPAASGGNIAYVNEGDIISIDIPNYKIELKISDEELNERKKKMTIKEPKVKTGYLARYSKLVSSADKGAILC